MTFSEWLSGSAIWDMLIASAAMLIALVSTMLVYTNYRRMRIEDKRAHMELDILRRQLEASVYMANRDLTADPKNFSDVNHLVIDSVRSDERSRPISDFFESQGVDLEELKTVSGLAFVLTPHHPEFDLSYRLIKSTTEALGYKVERGDETYSHGPILPHILKKIASSELVLANIDGRNPNVFYELGIAQAIGKRVILVTSEIESAPFDVRDQRMVTWSNEQNLELGLTRAIAAKEKA